MTEIDASQVAMHRSLAYGLFAQLYEYPDETLHQKLTSEGLLEQLEQSVLVVDESVQGAALWSLDLEDMVLSQLQSDFTRLFDVGAIGRPPCPLDGGAYAGAARMKSMEECLRFYNHFGLQLNQEMKAMPDQLGTELEFLHFLSHQQVQLLEDQQSGQSYWQAECDFLDRELLFWFPKMITELNKLEGAPFYKSLSIVLESFFGAVARRVAVTDMS
ncbi:MAG: hypothetical protein CMQ19_14125 [Gammaproteobacteria bacterium]|jgi:DMSO reductase family type II enzyme chaperone|nr:hypothetical protein [Gammaproteobacteria bacterium]|tara:strand:+ start:495 stop:1142 length:648 start_codon:yes stop_codon:yes gene_type:complete